jgi:putative transcriptional regulator
LAYDQDVMRRKHALAALFALLLLARAARPDALVPGAGEPPWRSLTGQMLVATDDLHDPRFVRTVIYMVRHESTGALGLVVNRPVGTAPLARVLESLGRDAAGVSGDILVHYGGPVEPARGFVLHGAEWTGGDSRVVQPGVAISSDPAVFEAIAGGTGPPRFVFALGYAGWAAGQLEGEIHRGSWIVIDADEALVFDDNAATKWNRAMARRKITL